MRRILPVAVLTGLLSLSLAVPASAAATPLVTRSSIITTVAGTGVRGFSGDGGPATSAKLFNPRGTAVGADGSTYIVDTYNNRVRKINPNGVISTIGGNGTGGYSGDGGPATQASMKWPHDVVTDADGVVYVADANNNRIRKIDRAGIITTVVGTGIGGYNGDGRTGPQTAIKLPKGLALYSHYLYFSDYYIVRRLDLDTNLVTTIAGTPRMLGYGGDGGAATQALLNIAQRIALDSVGNVYIADYRNQRVRRVDATSGIITTVAGNGVATFAGDGGMATNASLHDARGVALADDSHLYIGDSGNSRIRLVDLTTGLIGTVAGTGTNGYAGDGGPAGAARLNNPRGLTALPDGRLLFADTFSNAIRMITP